MSYQEIVRIGAELDYQSLVIHFEVMPAPRNNRRRWHELIEMITLEICATLGGCDTWKN